MNISIACCDDETSVLDLLDRFINNWKKNFDGHVDILKFMNGEDCLASLNFLPKPDIFFMDIDLKDSNGFRMAQLIKQKDINALIVFVTGLTGYVLKGYDIGAFNYLLKPVEYKSLCRVLNKALPIIRDRKNDSILLDSDNGFINMPIDNILYIESVEHHIEFVTKGNKKYKQNTSLQKIEKQLSGSGIVRCHRAFLVNTRNIYRIYQNSIYFTNDQSSIPLSRREKELVADKFIENLGRL